MADNVFDHIPQVAPSAGNALWAKVGEGIDAMMNMIIEGAGNLLGAIVTKGPGMVAGALAGGAAMAAGTLGKDPYDHNHGAPDATPQKVKGHDIEAPSRGKSIEVEAPRLPEKAMQAVNHERSTVAPKLAAAHVSEASLGDLVPSAAYGGKMQQQGMGIG